MEKKILFCFRNLFTLVSSLDCNTNNVITKSIDNCNVTVCPASVAIETFSGVDRFVLCQQCFDTGMKFFTDLCRWISGSLPRRRLRSTSCSGTGAPAEEWTKASEIWVKEDREAHLSHSHTERHTLQHHFDLKDTIGWPAGGRKGRNKPGLWLKIIDTFVNGWITSVHSSWFAFL